MAPQHKEVVQCENWPPRSPDLTPCDYFLWGHLKNKVYSTPPENTGELRERIFNEVNLLKRKTCRGKLISFLMAY